MINSLIEELESRNFGLSNDSERLQKRTKFEKNHLANLKRVHKKKQKRISVGGQEFESVTKAAKHFEVSPALIRLRYKESGMFRGMDVKYL